MDSLTLKQMTLILKQVEKHLMDGRHIKYVNFDYDNRSHSVWRITFRLWCSREQITFTNTNRPVEERRDLYEEMTEWLTEGEKK